MKIPLFDIDWTLLKGGMKMKRDAFDFAIKEVSGLKKASVSEIVLHGKTDPLIIKEVLELHSILKKDVEKMLPKVIKILESQFMKNQDKGTYHLLPGVKELLIELNTKNIPAGVLTGNIKSIGWKKLEKAGIKDFFRFGAFSDKIIHRVDLIPLALGAARLHIDKKISLNDLVIVGDSPLDVHCAKDGGVQSIAVAAGHYTEEDLQKAGADLVLSSLEEKDKFIDFIT